MTEPDPAPYVANVIAPRPGVCFRFVSDPDPAREGHPMRCPEPVAAAGVVVDPNGRRIAVEACAGHAAALTERREDCRSLAHRFGTACKE